LVINCAAYTAVDKAEQEPHLAAFVNRDAPANLARACKDHACKLIHISTDYVFDGENSRPYHEDDVVNPQSEYGRTKLEGENAITKSQADAMIIRTSWLYSEFGNNFLKSMLNLSENRELLTIVADQIGTPTYAGDLAELILSIADRVNENPAIFKQGIYHYSNEGVASWYDFTCAIFEYAKVTRCKVLPIESHQYPTLAKRPGFSVLNKSKIKKTYGIEVPHWRESLQKCIIKLLNNDNK